MSDNTKHKRRQAGFTIVELLVAISLLGIISVSLIATFSNYLSIITRNSRSNELTAESQNLLRATVEELRYGAGVRQTNTITDPNAPGGWNTSNSSFVIIIAMPAVDTANNYIIDPDTGSPYNNELVYFKEGTTLYKRTLANPLAVGNKVVTSCPSGAVTTTCPADRLLTPNTSSFSFELYDQDNTLTPDPLLARSININLLLERDTFGEPISFDNNIRITLRNQF